MDKFHSQGRQTHRRPSWGEAGGGVLTFFFFFNLLIFNSTGQLIAACKTNFKRLRWPSDVGFHLGAQGVAEEENKCCSVAAVRLFASQDDQTNSFTSTALNHNWDQILPEAEQPDYRSIWRVKQSIHVSDAAWHGTNGIMFSSHFSHWVRCSQAATSGWPLIWCPVLTCFFLPLATAFRPPAVYRVWLLGSQQIKKKAHGKKERQTASGSEWKQCRGKTSPGSILPSTKRSVLPEGSCTINSTLTGS